MTVSTTTRKQIVQGNGAATTFSFAFKTLDADHISVIHTDSYGNDTDLTAGVDYTLSLNGDQDSTPGGTVTYPVSGDTLPSGEKLTIVRTVPLTQTTDLQNQSAFYAETLEDQMDLDAMRDQQQQEELDRVVKISVSSEVTVPTMPDPSTRPNYYVRVNSDGDGFELVAPSAAATNVAVLHEQYTATAGQTIFTTVTSFTRGVGALQVYINGVHQVSGVGKDYVESTDNAITFSEGLDAGDVVDIYMGIMETNSVAQAANVSFEPSNGTADDVQSVLRRQGADCGFATIADQDATPSVAASSNLVTANTVATTITGFDDGVTGQRITVVFGDGSTTVDFTGTTLKGNSGADWTPADGDHLTGVFDGTNWYCSVSDNTA